MMTRDSTGGRTEGGAGVVDSEDGGDPMWADLFARIAIGDDSALEELFDLSAAKVYGLALWRTGSPDDASEVTQNTFVRLAERRAELGSVRNPRSWLFAVAHRLSVDIGRRRRVRHTVPFRDAGLLVASDADPDRTLDANRAAGLLGRLPAKQRDAIYLHLFAGLTFSGVAEAVGIPTFTAASRYRLGISKLRRLMGGSDDR
jgi:RNA polymerase sigma-70 factor, ECF subfamily